VEAVSIRLYETIYLLPCRVQGFFILYKSDFAMSDTPNYYAIIPANVRYCDELCANAKLLYGEITALCHKDGYCYASNQYFAELYKLKRIQTVTDWIKQLEKSKFIRVELIYRGKEIIQRRLYISSADAVQVQRKNVEPTTKKRCTYNEKTLEGTTKKRCDNNTSKINKEEKEREKEPLENSLSLSFDLFKAVATDFFNTGCTKKEPTKYKRNFAALCNIALGLSDRPIFNEKTVLQYNASQNEIEAINGEIKALRGSLDHFDKIREKATKNSKDGYIPRLLEKIISNEEYKTPIIVKENHSGVSTKNSNLGQHQQDPPKGSFSEKCADLLNLHSMDAVQIAHRIAFDLRLPKDEIILKAVEGFANWGKKENIIITNDENIGEVVHQFCEFVKEKNRAK